MLIAKIEGRAADNFRAYAMGAMTRSPNGEDHYAAAQKNLKFERGAKVKYNVEHVVLGHGVTTRKDGERVLWDLDAGKHTITKVVFYKGSGDDETVVGSVDVDASGKISVEFVEPDDGTIKELDLTGA